MSTEESQTVQHPMFDVLYDVRDKIDRVKALEADKARTASQYDEAQKVLRDKKTAGVPPSDEDMERVHDAMATRTTTRLEIMTIMQEIGASSEQIFSLRDNYEAYCAGLRKTLKPGDKPPPLASQVLGEIAEVMNLLKSDEV